MGSAKNDPETATEVLEEDEEITQAQAAELAGCHVKTIQRAQRSGRLPDFLTRAAIKRFADVGASEEIAKADAVGAIVRAATDSAKGAFEEARKMVETSRRTFETGNVALQKEVERCYARIESLETKLAEGQAVIDALTQAQYNLKQAEADAEVRKARGKAAIEIGKKYAAPVIARIFGGEELSRGAFQEFVDGLSNEQRDQAFEKLGAILDDEQKFQIAMLLQSFDTKESAKKENGGAPAVETPPAQPTTSANAEAKASS